MTLITEYSSWIIAWCALAMACGGLIKGALGVGTPLLTVPMMAMVLPPQMAIAIMAAPVVVANLWQVRDAGHPRQTITRFWPTFLALMIGTWIGVRILSGIDEQLLVALVGVFVICFTLLQASPHRVNIAPNWEKPAGAGFGMASGVIGGLSSMFGPMLILYLVSISSLDKNQFVGTISFLYVAAVVPWTAVMVLFGVLDWHLAISSILAVIPLLAGLLAGRALRQRIQDQLFHRLILIVLLVSGGSMLWRAWNLGSTSM